MKNASQYQSTRVHRRDRRFNKDATTQFAPYRNRFSLTSCACHAFIHINQADPTDIINLDMRICHAQRHTTCKYWLNLFAMLLAETLF